MTNQEFIKIIRDLGEIDGMLHGMFWKCNAGLEELVELSRKQLNDCIDLLIEKNDEIVK